jgi:hypothetical protein
MSDALIADAAAELAVYGVRPERILDVKADERGTLVKLDTFDLLIVPSDRPDAAGRSGVMLAEPWPFPRFPLRYCQGGDLVPVYTEDQAA